MSRLARQYAEAVYGLSRDRDEADRVGADLDRMAGLLDSGELRRALGHPGLPVSERVEIVRALLPTEPSALSMNLLRLLIGKGRDNLLPDIQTEFQSLADADRGVIHAEAWLPAEPGPGVLEGLVSRLGQEWGRPVRVSVRINPGLLGGMAVKVGDLWIDGSLSAQLERLRRDLDEPVARGSQGPTVGEDGDR